MDVDANSVLEGLADAEKTRLEVLVCRLELLVIRKRWEEAAILGESLCKLWPQQPDFWLRWAYCLHEPKRTIEARQTLLDAPESIRSLAVYHYNLACYEFQLGEITAAKSLLKTCFEKDATMKQMVLYDPDLEPVWESIK